jgi:hypothetical protein
MKTWEKFYDYYLRDLPGCSSFAAENELRKAAQEFCKRTLAWRATLDTMTLTTDTLYDFDVSSQEEVAKMLSAKLNGQDLSVLNREQFDDLEHGIVGLSEREFELYPAPSAGDELVIKVALYPSDTATGVEDFIYAAYAEAIAYGAKARLKAIKDKPYTDLVGADRDEGKFEQAISRAQWAASKGHSRAPLRTKANFF